MVASFNEWQSKCWQRLREPKGLVTKSFILITFEEIPNLCASGMGKGTIYDFKRVLEDD